MADRLAERWAAGGGDGNVDDFNEEVRSMFESRRSRTLTRSTPLLTAVRSMFVSHRDGVAVEGGSVKLENVTEL